MAHGVAANKSSNNLVWCGWNGCKKGRNPGDGVHPAEGQGILDGSLRRHIKKFHGKHPRKYDKIKDESY